MTTDPKTLRDVELELSRRRHEDPLELVYQPHEGQQAAHKARKPFTLVLGGNRVGKSWYAVAESLMYCLGRSKFAEMREPPVIVWYVMPSLTMFRRSIIPIIRKLAPRSEIRLTSHGDLFSKSENVIRFKNGSELHFLSADMKQRRLQGAQVDIAVMDETPDESVFEELQARVLQSRGRIIMVFSPIDAKTYWVRDKIYLPWTIGERIDVDVVMMPIADQQGHSLVPHMTDEDIARAMRQWPDPAIRAARVYGEFVARSGLIYKSFDPQIHVVKAFTVPDEFARWFTVDPQYHRFAALAFAADANGTYYITAEYFSQDEQLARRAERLTVMAGTPDQKIPVYVDSANPQDIAELNWHFDRLGSPLGAIQLPFQKKVETFILRVHSLLEPDDERKYPAVTGLKDVFGAPRLMFFDTLMSTWKWDDRTMQCSRLLWELQRLVWGSDAKPDKDSADGADCCDTMIYGANILASGVNPRAQEAWKRGLSTTDLLIWEAIDAADKRRDTLIGDY